MKRSDWAFHLDLVLEGSPIEISSSKSANRTERGRGRGRGRADGVEKVFWLVLAKLRSDECAGIDLGGVTKTAEAPCVPAFPLLSRSFSTSLSASIGIGFSSPIPYLSVAS